MLRLSDTTRQRRLPLGSMLAALGLALALGQPARAGEAGEWLDRMDRFFDQAPLSMNLDLDVAIAGQGQGLTVRGSGSILYADEKHLRMEGTLEMTFPGMSTPLAGGIKEIRDGEHAWSEIAMGPGPPKVSKERLAEDGQEGQAGPAAGRPVNPISQLRAARQFATFDAVEHSTDKVLLRGALRPELLAETAVGLFLGADPELRLSLRRSDAAPIEATVGPPGGPPVMTLSLRDIRRLTGDELPTDAFAYEPPEGTAGAR